MSKAAVMGRIPALLVMAALCGGCAHNLTRLERGCPEGPGGWCEPAAEVASATWEYAQLSQNVYWEQAQDSDDYIDQLYVLAPELKERIATTNDATGFAYSVFDRFEDGHLVEVVLAYRGVEGLKDWWHGMLRKEQAQQGDLIYDQLREGLDAAGYRDVPITLTGHSLGGKIADHVIERLTRDGGSPPSRLNSYTFNDTGRGKQLHEGPTTGGSVHTTVVESGEVAGLLRGLSPSREWGGYVIDCRPGLDPINAHRIRYLADCLTWIAAFGDDKARQSAERNELAAPKAVSGG